MYRARAYFDLAVLLAESDRRAEATTAFEAVVDLDLAGTLGQAAEQNLTRLQTAPDAAGRTRARRAPARVRRTLARTMIAAGAGVLLWVGWTQLLYPVGGEAALWEAISAPAWLGRETPAKPAPPRIRGSVVVAVKRLRVRSGRGTQYPTVKTMRRGQRLTVIGETEGWWKVRFPNKVVGWVARRYTGPLEEA
jgi:uncharacterized protein YgiM (DUF1202 family)